MQSTWRKDNKKDKHVAIIMDGNGRWATQRGLPRRAGHRAGVAALRTVIDTAQSLPIRSLTVYAFSADNWKRPAREISALFALLRHYLARELATLVENDVRLTVIGRRDRLPQDILAQIDHAEAITKTGRGLHVRIAFDYSARHAIAQAAQQAAGRAAEQAAQSAGEMRCSEGASETALAAALTADDGPANIDFLIRTGGEQRLSDFVLWEAAYAELYFSNTLWPDFDGHALRHAFADFEQRNRRFGGLPTLPASDFQPLHAASPLMRLAKRASA